MFHVILWICFIMQFLGSFTIGAKLIIASTVENRCIAAVAFPITLVTIYVYGLVLRLW